MTDYTVTDQIIGYLDRQLVRIFSRMRSLLPMDEINALDEKDRLYRQIVQIVRRAFHMLAISTYERSIYNEDADRGSITEQWVDELLSAYDPQSEYIFITELERRASRFVEAYIGSAPADRAKQVDAFMRTVSLMLHGLAVRVTDEAQLQALRDSGEDLFEWVAEDDNRTCRVCRILDGQVFDIDDFPKKPHFNCRCKKRGIHDGKTTPV